MWLWSVRWLHAVWHTLFMALWHSAPFGFPKQCSQPAVKSIYPCLSHYRVLNLSSNKTYIYVWLELSSFLLSYCNWFDLFHSGPVNVSCPMFSTWLNFIAYSNFLPRVQLHKYMHTIIPYMASSFFHSQHIPTGHAIYLFCPHLITHQANLQYINCVHSAGL